MNPIAFLHALWTQQAFGDTDWGANEDTKLSVYGFIMYFGGIPIAWKVYQKWSENYSLWFNSYNQPIIEMQLPIKVNVDKVGAIWLANNNSSGDRTRHINI